MWDLIVSVPDHCLSFYIMSSRPETDLGIFSITEERKNHRKFNGSIEVFCFPVVPVFSLKLFSFQRFINSKTEIINSLR